MSTEVGKAKPVGKWANMTRTKENRIFVAWAGVILVVLSAIYGLPWAFFGSAAWPFELVALIVLGVLVSLFTVVASIGLLCEWVEKGEK